MAQKQPVTTNPNRHWPQPIKSRETLDVQRLSNDNRIAYQQIYEIHDAHQKTVQQLQQVQSELAALKKKMAGPYPPGSGPIDSVVLGLPVQPIDTSTLADGVKLTFDKKNGVLVLK